MSRKTLVRILAGTMGACLLLVGAAVLILRSAWFYEKVRESIIAGVETATGGRAEVGSFEFDWKQMRVVVRQFVLHGNEPAGKEPLIRAASATLGLTIVSLLHRDVSLRYVDVQEPHIYLIVYPDGRTNIPKPKVKRKNERTAFETLVNLAIGRFGVQNGVFEIEGRRKTPFDARGRNLNIKLDYDAGASRYHGDLSVQPLDLQWMGQDSLALGVQMSVTVESNLIGVSSARITTQGSTVELSGSLENLAAPRASFRFQARAPASEVARFLHFEELSGGTTEIAGNIEWSGGANDSITGDLRASDMMLRLPSWQVRNIRLGAAVRVDAQGAAFSGVRFTAEAAGGGNRVPLDGRATGVTLRGEELMARGITLDALGGHFSGEASVTSFDRFHLRGGLTALEAKRAVALYSSAPLPWDSLLSGSVEVEGSLRRNGDVRVATNLALVPAPQGPPVRGQIAATYDSHAGTLDLGRSTVVLPSSRADFSGSIGREIRVHLETRDLNDFLPVLGSDVASIPLKLENGSALFDGVVTGKTEDPRVNGRLSLTRFRYSGTSIDTLQAGISASRGGVQVQNGSLSRGASRAQFQGTAGLHDWKVESTGVISGSGSLRNEPVADLLALANRKEIPATGTVNVTGQVSGTFGDPQFTGDLEVDRGTFRGEPFDRFTAHVADNASTVRVASGQLVAGAKQVRLEGTFDHQPGRLETGRVRFQIATNGLPLSEIRALTQDRPGIKGTVQVTASGSFDLLPAAGFRVTELQSDVTARGLQLTGQPLGDVHLTAMSQGQVLRTHLDSSFANSTVHGDGEWRLEGDYPGQATISFSKLDIAELREWIAPSQSGEPNRFAGMAEGEIQLTGPALKPELLKATLRVPAFEIRLADGANSLSLKNSGPILASMANSTLTVESAKLVGRSTDLSMTGKVSLGQRNPLDLRVNGHVDLAFLEALNKDIKSSGSVTADASIRGPLNAPQINGRLELKDAGVSYGELPNGITNGNGVILFSGAQATIQNLAGETGGGTIQLSGFAGYSGGAAIFRLHANSKEVRVRYPEGVSTVADASLDLTGTSERSMLAGTITIRRGGVNLQSDFSSLLAKSAEPVRTSATRTGFLAGLNYDVQIQTAPDIQFESALTQGLQADANLRLRGTAANPALLGRVNITQGQIIFFGTKYTINQGSISFFNPVRVEPVLNVDLETKARGIDITLTVAGSLSKLNITPRSDPPLQFNEIVSVLTTGQNPTSDTARIGPQANIQPVQQSTASALLGQVIASPVSGRLQRFFGISKLRINPSLDPTLSNGVQYNPQARLTLEQQVSPDLTFTYITNVTNANPQVVSVEWSVSKQWSVVALREENGLFGLDFYLKKRFR